MGSRSKKIERHVLRVLQLDMLAEGKVDALVHAGAHDRLAQFFMISIVKMVPRELSLDFIGRGHEKRRNIVPKKIDELIVGDNDQHVRLGLLQIGAQDSESLFRVVTELFLLLQCRP